MNALRRLLGILRAPRDRWEARKEAKMDARIRYALQGEAPREPASWEVEMRAKSEGWK